MKAAARVCSKLGEAGVLQCLGLGVTLSLCHRAEQLIRSSQALVVLFSECVYPLVAQLVERWTVEERAGIHRSLVQIRPGGHFGPF